jgi:uncharacterized protein YkwD
MFKSLLLAGFFWATSNFMPPTQVTVPTVTAKSVTSAAVTLPVPQLMASISHPALFSKVNVSEDAPLLPLVAASPESLTVEEQALVEKVNAERMQRGLNALAVEPLLVRTARGHSMEMCTLGYFNHLSPTPGLTSPMDRYLKALHEGDGSTPNSLLVGENIYYCSVFNDVYNVDYSHRALMNSPGHRGNILEPRFTKIGIGVYRTAKGEFWVTEMFSRASE